MRLARWERIAIGLGLVLLLAGLSIPWLLRTLDPALAVEVCYRRGELSFTPSRGLTRSSAVYDPWGRAYETVLVDHGKRYPIRSDVPGGMTYVGGIAHWYVAAADRMLYALPGSFASDGS